MSIAVGKRNFAQSFSKMGINDFQRDNVYRYKMVINENTLANRSFSMQGNSALFTENCRILSQQFPQVSEKELLTVLDDCDNDLEIAVEILQKSTQNKLNSPKLVTIEERPIKRITASKEEQKINNNVVKQIEDKRVEKIQEEDPTAAARIAEIKNLSSNVIEKLQTLTSMDEAKEFLSQIIYEVQGDTEKRSQVVLDKLKNDKAVLIKAFTKQRQKASASEEKNEELSILLNNHEQEIARLKTINYKLGLRLRALDENQEESHNFDIY